ncbi:MAG: NAD(P)/FAD-dependent oxidoreductase [Verrucomicrobiales bacterium]
MNDQTPQKVLILGGGFAGLKCAQELANDERFEVTLLDRQNHHLFQPLLYQVATAALSAPDIARSLRGILTKARNVRVLLDEVTEIDVAGKKVRSAQHEYEYDRLVVALGARTSYFGRDDWAEATEGLKSLEDSRRIRYQVLSRLERAELIDDEEEQRRLMTIVIVGGGPTGVELAGAFSDLVRRALKTDFRHIDPRNLRIILVQSGERLLKPYTEEHSAYVKERLEKLGVEVVLGPRVDEVEKGRVHLNDGRWIEAKTVIWAAGVQAHPLCAHLPGEKDRGGRLLVRPDLSLEGHPEVFAAGDIVNLVDKNGVAVPGVAPAAGQMGKHIGKVLKEDWRLSGTRYAGRETEFRAAFTYLDKGQMAIVGKNTAVAEAGRMKMRGYPAWVAWLFIHIAFLVGFRNKLAVLLSWSFNYVFDKPGARVFSVGEERE